MQKIGAYALLFKNSHAKATWKTYGFESFDDQINILISVLLYIMEESLKKEPCLIENIGDFIDQINVQYYKNPLSYEECIDLARYIVNVILCNDGAAMYFESYDYEERARKPININFVNNKIIYLDQDVKRTSYYLTDDGYNLLLSTLELDRHLQFTVQDIILKLQLEKGAYDKAVESVKQIFNLLRIQFQKIEEDMRKIKQNALIYTPEDYRLIIEENLETIEKTKEEFLKHREYVEDRISEFEEKDMSIQKLSKEERENLGYLKEVVSYLNRSIDEHQKILNSHFDLKILYGKELDDLSQMVLIQRFNLQQHLYEPVLKNPDALENLEIFLRPLFKSELPKTYNLNQSLELQKPIVKKDKEELFFSEELEDFDDEEWRQLKQKRLEKYEKSLEILIEKAEASPITLKDLKERLSEAELETLIPTVDIFKQIMVDLLQEKEIHLEEWRKEQENSLINDSLDFQLSNTLLALLNSRNHWKIIQKIKIERLAEDEKVTFRNLKSEDGRLRKIECSDVRIEVS